MEIFHYTTYCGANLLVHLVKKGHNLPCGRLTSPHLALSRSHPKWVCSFPFALKLYRRLDSICTESPVKHGCDGNNFDIYVDDDVLTAFIVKYILYTLIENYSNVCFIPNCYKTTMYIYHHQQKTIYIVYTIFTNYTNHHRLKPLDGRIHYITMTS